MVKKYKKGIAISAGLAVLIGATFSASLWRDKQQESPHYVDLACGVCHYYMQNTCISADCMQCHPIVGNDDAYKVLKADELSLCTSCHNREGDLEVENEIGTLIKINLGNSHPWGMVPSDESQPNTLPLNNGRIVCSTCHDVHSLNSASNMLRLYVPQTGQSADYTTLCLDCHEGY